MPDFLLELRSEEIPARMQDKARADLTRLFADQLGQAGLGAEAIETFATPRRLALIARGLPSETAPVSEEIKGPRAAAPPQALEGFLRKTGLTRDQLVDRDGVLFAVIDRPGRAAAAVLAEAIPAIVRAFPWPKSMRWGAASVSTESPRWVRPLQGVVALLGEEIVACEIAGVTSGAATVGHRFHHPGPITIGGAHDYAEKLRACHVILDAADRRRIIADGAAAAASAAGLTLVADDGLLAENAGLTEWPAPLLGSFDPAFLAVPREVIQLTMRTNQKYFALLNPPRNGEGDHAKHGGGVASEASLAPNFVCTANIEASDGGAAIVAGNERVLSARLSDAKFFWEQDVKVPLADQAAKLDQIVFHEKLGTVADKVERVAKLAKWLVEEGIVNPSPRVGEGRVRGAASPAQPAQTPAKTLSAADAAGPPPQSSPTRGEEVQRLAALAETAARLCKADLVTGLVGEFPELQGVIGGHLARAQGQPEEVADAIRDHYKPVGQGDEVPTAPVTVAVSLADKLDSLFAFFTIGAEPTGSRDPFALRRSALGLLAILTRSDLRLPFEGLGFRVVNEVALTIGKVLSEPLGLGAGDIARYITEPLRQRLKYHTPAFEWKPPHELQVFRASTADAPEHLLTFLADRLKVQQREAGVRHDLIDAVFALGGEDDLVRLLARVKALQAFVETPEGADLLAGYKRAANILKKEGWNTTEPARPERSRGASDAPPGQRPSTQFIQSAAAGGVDGLGTSDAPAAGAREKQLSYTPENEEAALIAALDSAEPRAQAAIAAEDFEAAMAALASLRGPVDAFFDKVTVNDADPVKRAARLDLLLRMREAVHQVADFSKIEG